MCRKEGQLTQVEHREKGALKGNVFLQYALAMGGFKVTIILLALVLGQATWIMSEWWLARWSQSSAEEQRRKMNMKLWVYGVLVACTNPLCCAVHYQNSFHFLHILFDKLPCFNFLHCAIIHSNLSGFFGIFSLCNMKASENIAERVLM